MVAKIFLAQCGPVVLGKKPSALFPVPNGSFRDLACLAKFYKLQCKLLAKRERTSLVLLYSPQLLKAALAEPRSAGYLQKLGYPVSDGLRALLRNLQGRMADGPFPHEVGFFLGYPYEDVTGFIENSGTCCKISGKWKVYGDTDHAQSLFKEFRNCGDLFKEYIKNGSLAFPWKRFGAEADYLTMEVI